MYGLTPFGRNSFGLWDAFDDFDRRFFGNALPTSPCRTDIRDDGDRYILESELPGFRREDISLDISGSQLTIAAERSSDSGEKDDRGSYIRRERSYGSYKRSFDISNVSPDEISAEYRDGVLTVELPKKKREEPVTKRLEIK